MCVRVMKFMRGFVALLFGLLVVGPGAGCTDMAEEPESETQDALRALVIGELDDGKTFTVEKGQSFKVSLSANSTVYKWRVVSTTRGLGYPAPRDGRFQEAAGGGAQVFTWKTDPPMLEPSSTAHPVTLEYRRPSDSDDDPPARRFRFKIKVKVGAAIPAPRPTDPIALFEEHNHSEVRVYPGQDVVVSLPETSTHRWYVVSDGDLDQPEVELEGGRRSFTWATSSNRMGNHTLWLKKARSPDGNAADTFSVLLVVEATSPPDFDCPPVTRRSIDCQPPVSESNATYCSPEYRSWAADQCDVQFVH